MEKIYIKEIHGLQDAEMSKDEVCDLINTYLGFGKVITSEELYLVPNNRNTTSTTVYVTRYESKFICFEQDSNEYVLLMM